MEKEDDDAVAITLNEILAVKYLNDWEWSPDGRYIALNWNDGGKGDCWLVPADGSSAPRQLTKCKQRLSGMAWAPNSNQLAVVMDGDIWLALPETDWFALERLTSLGTVEGGLSFRPDGAALAFAEGGQLWLYTFSNKHLTKCKTPGRLVAGSLHFTPTGDKLLYRYQDEDKAERLAVATKEGKLLWVTNNEQRRVADARWLDDNRCVYQVVKEIAMVHDLYLATLPTDNERHDYSQIRVPVQLQPQITHILHEEQTDRRGSLLFTALLPLRERNELLFSLERNGWLHHYLYSVETGELKQVTSGECEDFGHASDRPAISPDGQQFAYASNRGDLIRRDLWVYDLQQGTERKVTDFPVTNLQPKWSPDGSKLAFVHCDQYKNADLWVLDLEADSDPIQLTDSMPEGLAEKLQAPEHISYKGAQDWDLDGFLMRPANFDPNKRYPALVWVHGGPIRQMRGSWHPSFSYGHFYAVNQYLASKGYVVLTVNYRGGIGYGKEFRFGLYHKMGVDDVTDIVNAGRYLKSLPYVDEDKVAVYGLSYGGYMTLHCLTQYPDEFAMGINFAGIWDYAQWARWIESRGHRGGTMFAVFFGGMPMESPELYAQGSPVTFKHNLKRPLINFHGTKDANVDFEQLDRIVEDCVQMGKTYEAYYYPGEVHMFAYRHTWRDVLPKMERELERYLR